MPAVIDPPSTMPEVLPHPGYDDPNKDLDVESAVRDALADPWNVILWNDDVTPIDVPVEALRMVIGLSRDEAIAKTLYIHEHGKAIVATTTFEKAEFYHAQMTEVYKLTVTIEKAQP